MKVLRDTRLERKRNELRDAALELYNAGIWMIDDEGFFGEYEQQQKREAFLWENLRNAIGLEPGHATARGVGRSRYPSENQKAANLEEKAQRKINEEIVDIRGEDTEAHDKRVREEIWQKKQHEMKVMEDIYIARSGIKEE